MKDYQTSVFQLYKSRLLSQKYESKFKLEKKSKVFFKEMRVVCKILYYLLDMVKNKIV